MMMIRPSLSQMRYMLQPHDLLNESRAWAWVDAGFRGVHEVQETTVG